MQCQCAYPVNRSREDFISMFPHTALSHWRQEGKYVRMLFIDYSSAFNKIIRETVAEKNSPMLGSPPTTTAALIPPPLIRSLNHNSQRQRTSSGDLAPLVINQRGKVPLFQAPGRPYPGFVSPGLQRQQQWWRSLRFLRAQLRVTDVARQGGIVTKPSHPRFRLFTLLPSRWSRNTEKYRKTH